MLAIQTESKEVDVQLRVLQAVPLLMTPPHFQMSSAMLAQVLTICLRYYGVSDPIIHHTADATLRQVVTLLFERVERVSNEGHDEVGAGGESNPSATAAGLLFKVGMCMCGCRGLWQCQASLTSNATATAGHVSSVCWRQCGVAEAQGCEAHTLPRL